MNVKELIAKLGEMPQDMAVCGYDDGTYYEADSVWQMEGTSYVNTDTCEVDQSFVRIR